MAEQVIILIPVFNDGASLNKLLEEMAISIRDLPDMKFRVLVVDDGSTDGSLKVLRELARHDSRVRVVALRRNYGQTAAMAAGFEEVVVKVKNRYYDMRAVHASLQFNVAKHEPHEKDTNESKIYFSKLSPAELARGHRSVRTVVYAE